MLAPTETKVLEALGATRKGGRWCPGTDASVVALADVPSPQTIRVDDGLGSTRPCIVGLMPRPAPESIMTSPSALHSDAISLVMFALTSPGSKGKLVVSDSSPICPNVVVVVVV